MGLADYNFHLATKSRITLNNSTYSEWLPLNVIIDNFFPLDYIISLDDVL
jgi:hypothetical protein